MLRTADILSARTLNWQVDWSCLCLWNSASALYLKGIFRILHQVYKMPTCGVWKTIVGFKCGVAEGGRYIAALLGLKLATELLSSPVPISRVCPANGIEQCAQDSHRRHKEYPPKDHSGGTKGGTCIYMQTQLKEARLVCKELYTFQSHSSSG